MGTGRSRIHRLKMPLLFALKSGILAPSEERFARISNCKKRFFTLQSGVRIDLFLKTSKLIKRRTRARELCDEGRVWVNGHEAKPAKEVQNGDIVTLRLESREIVLEIVDVPDASNKKSPSEPCYRITAQTRSPKEKDVWSENRL